MRPLVWNCRDAGQEPRRLRHPTQGTLLKFIPVAEDIITNNAFGEPDMKTLHVTAGKNLYAVRMEMAGLPR